MPLITCPDCKEKVSDQAEKCPKCGRSINKSQSAVGVLAAIIIGLGLGYFLLHAAGYV